MKPTRFTPEMIRDFLSKGYWTNETTSETWDRNAELFGLEEAMVDSTRRLTWNDFKRKSDTLAMNFLEMGFQKDDIFFILLPNCVDAYITKLACEKAGIICIASLMTLRENEIEDILKTYDVKAIIIPEKFKSFNCYEAIKSMKPNLPKLEYIFCTGYNVPEDTHSVECLYHKQPKKKYDLSKTRLKVDELGALGLTSGTTGVPKVAEHTIGERVALWNSYVKKMDLKKSDVVLNVLNPVTGSCGYYSAKDGAKRVVMDIWDAKEALRLIEEERVTAIITTPAQLSMLIKEAGEGNYDTSSLRVILAGTAPMTPELAMACEQKLGVILVNSYGSMDGGGISNVSIYDDENTRYYTAGKVHLGNEIKIVDDDGNEVPKGEEGELILRGAITSSGIFKDLEKTIDTWGCLGEDGWFHTGDRGKFDEQGNLVLTGRKKDMINRGGQNIYPHEIEGMLFTHPKVKHVAIVPMPDPVMGEKACAFVVPKDGENFTFEEMTEFLLNHKIAKYKLPERLEIRKSLPLRGEHKVLKKELINEIKEILKKETENQGETN